MESKLFLFTTIIFFLHQNIFGQSAWEKVDTDLNKPFRYIFFLSENIGWGFSSVYNSSTWKHDNEIHRTTNGGLNWTSVSLTEDIFYIFKFYFVTQDTAWGIGNGKIFKTNNSGQTWDLKFPLVPKLLFGLGTTMGEKLCFEVGW